MWSPALPAMTARVDFSPPASRSSRDARIWPGRALRRRGRALQAIQIPWVGSALKQGFSSAPCTLVLVSNSDVTQVERGEVDRALPGHRRPCNSEVSGEVRLPQLFDAGPEFEEP